ncbi:MAG TPA: ROK family transcriptional regulator [Vicinamibacterales bacterium]|nr:ROK family transcriptional regulator [Vicinamibacterales bacterium]
MRGLNLDRVLSVAMDRTGTFTRAELIDATGLSAPTVGGLASYLIRTGVIADLGSGPSRGGRRPSLMEFNARHGFVAGIDLGPTRTRLAIADLRGEPVAHRIIPTPSSLKPAAMLGRIAAALRSLVRTAGVPYERVLVVTAGAPGPVNLETGTVAFAPNLRGWVDVPMRAILQRALGVVVLVENDVNLALLGERWHGAARGHDTCAFVFVGTGLGAAILINGRLHHGHHYMAGEIGVMCMGTEYADVDFGSRGCLETLAGLDALRARWPEAERDDPARWLTDLVAAADEGDAVARQALADTARLIGIAAANVGAVVDPSVIVLGGAMFAQAGRLVELVRSVVQRLSRTAFDIVLSELGKEAPLAGCLLVGATEARAQLRHKFSRLAGSLGVHA